MYTAWLRVASVSIFCACVARAQLPTYAQIVRSGISLSHFRSRFEGGYDQDGDGAVTRAEIARRFEYLSAADLEEYWKECDVNLDAVLSYEEWVPCAGAYSDNGERFLETEWDSLMEEGILNLDGGRSQEEF